MGNKENLLLEVENLKVYFFTRRGVIKAVNGVNFSLSKGETLGMVGESGCGKTITGLSILRIVPEPAGRIVEGRIMYEGEDLLKKSLAEMRKIRGAKISMILQDSLASLNPAFNIGNQIGEAIELHQKLRGKALWQKVVESLRLVRIPATETRARDYPHQMSGGMRQRVTGAIAFSCQPSLLIADEPTTSLDVTIQAQYLRLLTELQERTKTSLIFITHDFGIVARMCDRVAVMYAGKIVETAETIEIFNNPRHPYTKALMGCLPKMDQKVQTLTTIEGQPPQLNNLPPGCNFAPRCSEASEECYCDYPPRRALGRSHDVSCWHAC
jgi:oligopeptide/dipeptide ABC transporter ATP-binding protein